MQFPVDELQDPWAQTGVSSHPCPVAAGAGVPAGPRLRGICISCWKWDVCGVSMPGTSLRAALPGGAPGCSAEATKGPNPPHRQACFQVQELPVELWLTTTSPACQDFPVDSHLVLFGGPWLPQGTVGLSSNEGARAASCGPITAVRHTPTQAFSVGELAS